MAKRELTEEEKLAEKMKYEVAEELGLLEKVQQYGWQNLTSRESGRIGGILSRKKRDLQKAEKEQEAKPCNQSEKPI